jgi:nucleotide-binding universal stress UspA family protein
VFTRREEREELKMIESILVATDGSECAAAAERCAIALAARLRASVTGITVIEESAIRAPSSEGLTLPPYPESELAAFYQTRAELVSRRFSERARAEGLEASCEIVQGSADDRIVEKALSASLFVIGRDSKPAGHRGALIGATADAAIRKSNKPVLVVPAGSKAGGSIVLGFDGSAGSRQAAEVAVGVANGLGESVQVFVDSKDKGRAVTRFEEVRQFVSGLSLPVRETSSTLGRPDVKIVDAARESRAGMIVMGAFGRNRITDYFIGSNAAAVIRTSPIPVLLAR